MRIVFHIGAHATDDGRLMRSLLKNRDLLARANVVVPGPSRYRDILQAAMARLRGAPASTEARDVLVEALCDSDEPDGLILFDDSFICAANRAIEDGILYARAAKAAWLRNLFPGDEVEFCIGLRNVATFVPALHAGLGPDAPDLGDFLSGFDPMALSWSDYLSRLAGSVPDCPVTVWCNEDTPFLWPELMATLADLDPGLPLEGTLDIVLPLLAPAARQRLVDHLAADPPETEMQRRRIVAAFLEESAVTARVEEEIDLPGWTPALVDRLTEAYDDDVSAVARIPGVTLIAP